MELSNGITLITEHLKISFFLFVVLETGGNYGELSEINIAYEQASLVASA